MNKKFFKDFMSKENRWKLILVLLLLVILYIFISFFTDNISTLAPSSKNKVSSNNAVSENEKEKKDYEEQQKNELKNILKKVDGIGNVEVMLTFESDESKVPATDSNKQTSVTEETDNNGGKRTTNQNTDSNQVVMETKNGENSPLIIKTYKPKIVGVMIVAEGAEDSKIKYEISQAVSTLYGISLDKVNVYPMKK